MGTYASLCVVMGPNGLFETAGWRSHPPGLGKKTLQTLRGKHFLLLKKMQ